MVSQRRSRAQYGEYIMAARGIDFMVRGGHMARSILSLVLGFGSVSIPVRIYKAKEDGGISFHQYHSADKGSVKYDKVCASCGKHLQWDQIEKGKQVGREIILFKDEELDAMRPTSSRTMRIIGFYDPRQIPEIAFGEPYYVGTEMKKNGGVGAPFTLFRDALKKSGKVCVVGWVSRGHDHYGMLEPYDELLLLKELSLASDVRPTDDIELLTAKIPDALVKKAVSGIIMKLTKKEFDWDALKDGYAETVSKYVEAKALGEEVTIEEFLPEKPSEVRDLESLLDQSAAALER
jgi:DNA end-binding protein Ku